MAFTPNDSIELLLKAKLSGTEDVKKFAQDTSALDSILKNLDQTLQRTNSLVGDTNKGIASLTSAVENMKKTVSSGGSSLDDFSKSLKAIIANPATSISGNPFAVLGRGAQQLIGSLGPVGIAFSAVGLAFTALGGAALSLVETQATAARELANFASRLDISVLSAQKLQFQAALTGVNLKALEQSARLVGTALDDPNGSGKKQVAILQQLGVATRTAAGEQRELGDVVLDILQKLSGLSSASQRAHDGQVLLGRSSKELVPLIQQYEATSRAAELFADSISTNATARLADARLATSELGISFDILKKNLAAAITPIVIPFVTAINGVVSGELGRNLRTFSPNVGFDASTGNLSFGSKEGEDQGVRLFGGRVNAGNAAVSSQTGSEASARLIADNQSRIERANLSKSDLLEAQLSEANKDVSTTKSETGVTAESGTAYDAALKKKKSLEDQLQAIKDGEAAAKKAAADRKRGTDEALKLIEQNDEKYIGEIAKLNERRDFKLAELNKLGVSPALVGKVKSSYDRDIAEETQKELQAYKKAQNAFDAEAAKLNQERNGESNKFAFEGPLKAAYKSFGADREIDNIAEQTGRTDLTRQANKAVKIGQLQSTPGNEVQDVSRSYQIRLGLANDLFQLDNARAALETNIDKQRVDYAKAYADLTKERQDAELERELAIAELKRKELDQFKSAAGSLYDSLFEKGGVTKLLESTAKGIGKTVFENASTTFLNPAKINNTLQTLVPGQRNADGSLTTKGKLLANTPFGNKGDLKDTPLITSQGVLKQSVDALRVSIDSKISYGSGGGLDLGGGSGAFPSSVDSIGGLNLGGLISSGEASVSGGPLSVLSALAKSPSGGGGSSNGNGISGLLSGLGHTGDIQGILTGVGGKNGAESLSTNERIGGAVGTAGAVVGGGLKPFSDFKKGGASGIISGIGDVAGTAAALDPEPISKAILTTIAIATPLITSLLGDPKADRLKAENAYVHNNQSDLARTNPLINSEYDTSGSAAYTNSQGISQSAGNTVHLTVNALDSSSILDRSNDISHAVLKSLNESHPLTSGIQNLLA